jgi:hypothetical protein
MTNVTARFLAFAVVGVVLGAGVVNAGPAPGKVAEARRAYQQHMSQVKNTRYLALIDYSKPIFATRLWVIDLTTGKPVLSAHVAHAFKSGLIYATRFSNASGSRQSCAGSFLTQSSEYAGRFGPALRVTGLDPCNDQALARAIVFHPTRFPYTWGCFATSRATNAKLISLVKGGAFVYVAR